MSGGWISTDFTKRKEIPPNPPSEKKNTTTTKFIHRDSKERNDNGVTVSAVALMMLYTGPTCCRGSSDCHQI